MCYTCRKRYCFSENDSKCRRTEAEHFSLGANPGAFVGKIRIKKNEENMETALSGCMSVLREGA